MLKLITEAIEQLISSGGKLIVGFVLCIFGFILVAGSIRGFSFNEIIIILCIFFILGGLWLFCTGIMLIVSALKD